MRTVKRFFTPPPIDTPDLSIHGIGIMETMLFSIVNRPQGTGDYLIMMFASPVSIRVSGEDRACPADTLMIWEPSEGHVYGNASQEWLHSWIHCDGTRIGEMLANIGIPVNQPLSLRDRSMVDHYLWEIYREVTSQPEPDAGIVANALDSCLRDVKRQTACNAPAVPPDFFALKQYIGENMHQPMTLTSLADRVNLSVSHFSVLFKAHFGLAPIEYLIEQRMHTASILLRDGNRSVADVAHAVGYDDPFHFSRRFKARFNVSPRNVRKGGAADEALP